MQMPIEPPGIPPATPGNPTEPPPESPPGSPKPDIPPPVRELGEPARPDELPGKGPDEVPVRGPDGPRAPFPETDVATGDLPEGGPDLDPGASDSPKGTLKGTR